MFKTFFLTLILIVLPWATMAQGDTGVQARVLPSNIDVLLEILDWDYEILSDTEVLFTWETNLPAIAKIEYGDTWLKGNDLFTEIESLKHEILLRDLYPGTLYYFNLSAFNDNDSISLGDNTFKSAGQRKVLDYSRKLDKPADENLVGATKKMIQLSPYPEDDFQYNSRELFLLEDLSVIFIILSILLVLFLVYKKLRQQNKEKGKHWEKLDK